MEGNGDNKRFCSCITSPLELNINNGEMLKIGDGWASKMMKDALFLRMNQTLPGCLQFYYFDKGIQGCYDPQNRWCN